MDAEKPIPTMAAKRHIHEYAEQMAIALGFEAGDALEPIVARLGGTITFLSASVFEGSLPPSIQVESESRFTIYLPSTTSPQRDRFTVAHELGHLLMHYPMVQRAKPGATMIATRWVDESDTTQQRAEWEANWFAAAFLMPAAAFSRIWKENLGLSSAVASMFDVSEQAADIRAKSLNLA